MCRVLKIARAGYYAWLHEPESGRTIEDKRLLQLIRSSYDASYPDVQFTFLGYTFRPCKAVDKYKRVYVNFSPAVSRDALKAMRQTIRKWHLHLMCNREISDLSAIFNPILQGWQQYYGRFHGSAMSAIWQHMNAYLIRWMRRKYKNLARHKRRARYALGRLARDFPNAFVHWKMGCLPSVG